MGCSIPQPLHVEGVLQGEHVWSGEVRVLGDVVFTEDSRLTILPGTEVLFLTPDASRDSLREHPHFPGSELIIRGEIVAIGRGDAPIIFRSDNPTAPAGSWGALNIEGSPKAIFEYCHFRQADSAVHCRESVVYIEQSLFEDNVVGIRFHSSEILVENNLLRNNHTGVRFHFGAPVICNNIFSDNSVNLFITSHPRDYQIRNNSFGRPTEYQVTLGENVPEDVDLSENYWLLHDDKSIFSMIYDGRRSPYLGLVQIEPALKMPSSQVGLSWTP